MPRETYDGIAIHTRAEEHEKVAGLLGDLPRGSKVLDVPAGAGALSKRLSDMGFAVEAGDLEPDSFEAEGINCTALDLNAQLPFEDESFDAAVCVEGIEHLENPFGLIRELCRVLKQGGRLVITTPNITSANSRLRFFLTGFVSVPGRPINEFRHDPLNDHINPLTYPQLRYMLHTSGLRITTVTGAVKQAGGWYRLLLPLGRSYFRRALRKEKDLAQREVNAQIAREMFSPDLLFSRVLIVVTEKR